MHSAGVHPSEEGLALFYRFFHELNRTANKLIISGIRTEQCCETTTRHASDLGWQVSYVTEATMTWDIPLPDGTVLRAADIRARTAAVLHDRFAQVQTVAQALA